MFNNGAKIVKVDFHMHTNSDKEFSYNGDPDYYISNYISKMNTENIGVGVITNHNKFVKDEYIKFKKTAKKKDVLILPGVELSIKEGANGVHTLIIFDPEQWLSNDTNKIEIFLNEVFTDTPNRENENTRCKYDLPGVLEKLEQYNSDYFIVFAHIEDRSGFLKECDGGLIRTLAANPRFKKRVLGLQKVRTRDKIAIAESHIGYKLPYLEGSDCKNIDMIGKEKGFSYIKLGDFSFAALKFALQAHSDRVFNEEIIRNYSYIKEVAFEGGLLDGTIIGLSPELNTFIGIRGSGKSSVIELIRYALSLSPTVDETYKNDLVKYVLESGGVVCLNVIDEHGKQYKIRRIYGEAPYVMDNEGNSLGIDVKAIIRNPVYFGQKDLALTKNGYEFELLHKLLGSTISDNSDIVKCLNSLKSKLGNWFELGEIPGQIEDLKTRLNEINHKLKIFEERGVAVKLTKQTSYAADSTEIKSVISNCKLLQQRITGILDYYDELSIITEDYTSDYNQVIFDKLNQRVSSIKKHFEIIRTESHDIEEEIEKLSELEGNLELIIDELKEEFAEIRRELSDTHLDIDAFGKYKNDIDRYTRDLQAKESKLKQIDPLRIEILQLINQRTELMLQRFNRYKTEIDRVNRTQDELVLSIAFKGDKKIFLQQLREQFKGSGITEAKYTDISNVFSDFVALIEDVLFHNGDRIQNIITSNQFVAVLEKVKNNFAEYILLETPDKVEIKYHGKILSRHSTGQRASALALFILAQKDNDVIIIDQPEDDLDNQVIYTEFIKRVKEKKGNTQFIFATHNANIPVLGDAERVVAATFSDSKMEMYSGTIDTKETHKQIITIMEGGPEAFQRRNSIYDSWS